MGANELSSGHHPSFSQDEWEITPIQSFTKLKDPYYNSNFKILTNKLNRNLQVEKYDLVFNSTDEFQVYKEAVAWRNANRFLVSAKHVQQLREQGICTTFSYAAIYIERIPVRLYEIEDISLQQGLYILYAAVQGFQKLYQKYGYFQIQSEMIGFTREGYVKVWVNKNLSKNYPENMLIQHKNKTYEQFIVRLLNIIENLIDFQQHVSISKFIQKKKIQKPFSNFNKIIELYNKQVKITFPRYLSSIRNLCKNIRKTKNSSRFSRYGMKTSQTDCNRSFLSKKYDKNLQLNNTVYNISINTPNRRSFMQKLQNNCLDKSNHSLIMPRNTHSKNISTTTYSIPYINFHYNNRGLPDSPQSMITPLDDQTKQRRKTFSTMFYSNNEAKAVVEPQFMKSKHIFLSNEDKYQIDPEIAADLEKIEEQTS